MTAEPIRQAEDAGAGPELLLQMAFSFGPARVLATALQLRVFSFMAAGQATAQEIAQAAGASERGMRMLLDALVGFQLLGKTGERYELTPDSAQYLVRDAGLYRRMMESEKF